MANRILSVLFKKKYTSGDTDTIYMRNRAKDVYTGEAGSATMDTIVTKVNGMATGATKVAGSSSNGYISINGTNTKVYTHPNSGATAGTYNQVTVNAQGHVTAGSNITTWTGSVSGSVANATSTFTRASSRSNLTSGEKISVSLGKISKWFADLKGMAFVDKVGVSNLDSTLTTQYNKRVTTDDVTQSTSITEAGWVADARVIRTLQNQINTLNSNVQNTNNELKYYHQSYLFDINKHTSIWDYLKDNDFLISGKDLFVTFDNVPTDYPAELKLNDAEGKVELLRDRNKDAGRIIVRITPYHYPDYKNGSYYRQYFQQDTSWRGEWYSPIKDLRDSKADKSHTHDDRYYTEAEINNQMNNKANKNHQSSSGEYGTANQAAYGHVKTTDNYKAQTSDDIVLNTRGAYNMYNWVYSLIDDERYFRTYGVPAHATDFTIRSTNKNFGEWILLVNVGHHAVIISCMVSRLGTSLSTSYTFYKTLVAPSDVIISGVQGMIEGGDHVLIRVFLSSRWQNGYGSSIRVLNRAGALASVGPS